MKILLVDDQKTFLDSLCMVVQKEFPDAEIFKALNGNSAIEMITKVKPEVLLLDVNMPVMNGLEVAEYVIENHPLVKIVMLTNITGKAMVLSSMMIVHGFLFKDVGGQEIREAIQAVLRGDKYFCPNSSKVIIKNMNSLDKLPYVQFTKWETDLVEMMATGKTSKEMAKSLNIKERTVNHHREELLKKTKTKNTHELITFAFINGLILISETY